MPIKWKFFGLICVLQLLATAFFSITSFINLFQINAFYFLLQTIAFLLMTWLTMLALNILNNNYPDMQVAGRQKTIFNWLFLFNFLLIAFLFGLVISEYKNLKALTNLLDRSIFSLPFKWLLPFFAYAVILVFQFIILYGLYAIRVELYRNFISKQFEFEKKASQELINRATTPAEQKIPGSQKGN